ncbi:helix-turn-helix domain-containing protein [Pseudomonas taiwanensis]|uniref:helix-turn-helix domain-containing protein n=1 Tax=Pseudomonas taiwanensis TaxID=470150 RepID=UPI0004830392|nr:helix-turn-helix domain-containing protein [Pseudomonas taiwanensis]
MALRTAFAAALRFLRAHRDLSQADLGGQRDQSHVSRLEAAQRNVTLKVSEDLAKALELDPMTLLTVVYAAERGTSPRQILKSIKIDLEKAGLLDADIPLNPASQVHPISAQAATLRKRILELKAQDLSQAEIARQLGVSGATVSRHLHKTS